MRTFVVGDIHGCYDELMELVEKIGLKEEDLLISVGDVVDRGNKSKEAYEYFRNRPNSIALMGNHERKHQRGILSYAQEIVKVQLDKEYQGFLQWVNTLGYFIELDDAIVIHAAFENGIPLNEQKEEVLCGSTAGGRYMEKITPEGGFWYDYYTGSKPIIYGHHVVGDVPKTINNTYGIDTGCCHGNYLTAIELPGFIFHQVKAKKDYWKEEQRLWQIPVLKAKDWDNMQFADIDKQLDKLAYVEEPLTVEYLAGIKRWKEQLQGSYTIILEKINSFCEQLLQEHQENFSMEANQHPLKTFLFKSRANTLRMEDLQKSLPTPNKVMEVAKLLNFSVDQ